ncbi:MAG: tellurite resistance TerB family protein [Elusimicrobiales bacterium]|jgi:tellurite resistance protein|nr:tellurite resistance TerB family protein [Elusimicrobiales bacterium]
MKKTSKPAKTCGCACGCSQSSLTSPADAVMALCVMAIASDGKLEKHELARIDQMIAMSPLFDGVMNARDYAACISETIAEKGRASVIEEAAELLPGRLAETAYAWAASMVMADGKAVSPEHKFLSSIRKALGVHGVLAGKINAVVAILNRAK